MSDRPTTRSFQVASGANAAGIALAVLLAAPALASRIPCPEGLDAEPDSSVTSLIAETVGHNVATDGKSSEAGLHDSGESTSSLLAPRAEEAIRDAFQETDSAVLDTVNTELPLDTTPPVVSAEQNAAQKAEAKALDADKAYPATRMNTRLPGVSDVATSRYKKQMFRRDI